jgi:hypothetical protein
MLKTKVLLLAAIAIQIAPAFSQGPPPPEMSKEEKKKSKKWQTKIQKDLWILLKKA